ncbi:hypothetical protein BD414DRAFT_501043 [Trametes punicea]|nr:hypothetical protein BD414DRAFT_501043 [Trametes punicea]
MTTGVKCICAQWDDVRGILSLDTTVHGRQNSSKRVGLLMAIGRPCIGRGTLQTRITRSIREAASCCSPHVHHRL